MTAHGLLLSFLLWIAPAQADTLPGGFIALDDRPAPALELAGLDGKITDLAALRGQWAMVHFWAAWCGPCRQELPAIAAMAKTKPVALALVMVNVAETEDEVSAFLSSVAPALSTLLDKDGRVMQRWQSRGLPATFFVDPQGRLRYLALGGRPWDSEPYRRFLASLTPEKQK